MLDVGGGKYAKMGYVNVDPFYEKADVAAFAWDLPYEVGSVDVINCCHMLEHLEKRKVIPTLQEFYRVLRPGGKLVVEVPDLEWCCINWLEHKDDGWSLDAIFGNQDPPGGQVHMTGFTPGILMEDLRLAGFRGNVRCTAPFTHNQKCIRVELTR